MIARIPPRISRGQAITAEWANSIREAIQSIATGMPTRKHPTQRQELVPLRVSGPSPDESGEIYTVSINPGWVVSSNPADGADPVFQYHMPEIDGVPLDDENPPTLEVEDGQTVYLLVNTDSKDQPTSVEIVADDQGKAGLHHHPPPNATNGEYYYPLADIEEIEIPDPPPGTPETRLIVTNRRQLPSPFVHRQLLVELRNVGVDPGRPIYKENIGDIYDIRSLEQLEGGVPCLKPLADEVPPLLDEDGNPVLDENGDPVEPGQPAEEEGDTLKLKAFRVETGPPAEFDEQEDVNELKFTADSFALDNPFVKITTNKGFVTLLADGDGGANFNLMVLDCALAIDGSTNAVTITAQSGPFMFYVRKGIIGLTDDLEPVDTYELIGRISGSSGSQSGPGFTAAPVP
jgi:hypothetical protein